MFMIDDKVVPADQSTPFEKLDESQASIFDSREGEEDIFGRDSDRSEKSA